MTMIIDYVYAEKWRKLFSNIYFSSDGRLCFLATHKLLLLAIDIYFLRKYCAINMQIVEEISYFTWKLYVNTTVVYKNMSDKV